jgi:GH25 family lysozyme M1 (1,4-beta-N-acetylmuramidase)
MLEGIDVAEHQKPPLNLGGVDFLIVRATMGGAGVDKHGRTHLRQGAEAGLEVLVAYHYLRGDSLGEVQARHFLEHVAAIDHDVGYVGLMVDVENLDPPNPPWHVPTYRKILIDFLDEVRAATARLCVIYGLKWLLEKLELPPHYADLHPLMLADWAPPYPVPKPWKKATIHQYSNSGGKLDRDRFEGTIGDLRQALGLDRVSLADARLGALAERVRRATGSTSAETFVEVDEGPKTRRRF